MPFSTRGLVVLGLIAGWGMGLTAVLGQEIPPRSGGSAAARPSPKGTVPPRDDEPKVLTSEEMGRRGRSAFLDAAADSSDSRGSGQIDAPPWKQAAFFGVRCQAQTVIFVVDCSESMKDADRLLRAKRELRKSVGQLQFPQRFSVLFYNEDVVPIAGLQLRSADSDAKSALSRWLNLIEAEGGTDPRSSLNTAIGMNPDAIFLLSDGLFPEGTAESVKLRNQKRIPIHCIDMSSGAGGDQLRQIAGDSGGRYAARD